MIQEDYPKWPEPGTSGYTVSHETLARIGNGDAKEGRRILRALIDLEVEREPITGPTQRPLNTRAAVEADEAPLLELIHEDLKENATGIAEFSEEKIERLIRQGTRRDRGDYPGVTIGVADTPDGIAGFVTLVPFSWWFSDEWFIMELAMFVSSKHRGRHIEADLFKFARWFTDDMSERAGSRVRLFSGVTSATKPLQKSALYRRLSNFCGILCVYPAV